MSVLAQKFHVKKNNIVYECNRYSTEDEATPKTIENGSCMPIRYENITGYVGLWPKAISFGDYHTPLTAKKDGIEYWVETQVNNMVNITINQVAHQTITVTVDGVAHTSSFTAMAGSFYEINLAPDPGYNAGFLNTTNVGYLTNNLTVTASEASRIRYTIIITNPTGQTVSVQHNGKTRRKPGFYGYYGETWTASVAVASGYTQGTLIPGSSGTITGNEEISVTDPAATYYTVTLAATTHQTITLSYKQPGGNQVTIISESSAKTLQLKSGTTWTASITGNNGYTPGELSPGTSGTIDANTTITASAAALNGYTITLAATSNQTITFRYTEPGGSQVTRTSTSSAQSLVLRHGTTWTATITGATGYNAGTLSPGTSGTITAATTITASAATLKTYALKLNGTTNQTITLRYTEPGASQVTKTSTSSTQTFTVKHGTTWTATVAGATGYNPGALSPGSSGTVTAAATISAAAATIKTFTLTLAATTHQTITLKYTQPSASQVTKTSTGSAQSVTVKYGTTWTATVAGATGWNSGSLSPGSSGTVTAATTVSASAATHKTYKITLTQKTGETVTIHYKNHNGSSLASSWSTTTSSVTLGHGSQYYSTIAASTGWTAGTITSAGSSSSPNTLTGAVTISFTAATHKTYKITLTQKANETVTIHYKNHNGSSLASSWSTTTSSITLGHGSQYYLTISASTGYTAGSITNAGSSSSPRTLTAAVTVSFNAATATNYTLKVKSTGAKVNGTARADNWSGSFAYNQQIKISNSSTCDEFVVRVWKNLDGSGTVWKESGYISSGSTYSFNMPASNVSIRITLSYIGGE